MGFEIKTMIEQQIVPWLSMTSPDPQPEAASLIQRGRSHFVCRASGLPDEILLHTDRISHEHCLQLPSVSLGNYSCAVPMAATADASPVDSAPESATEALVCILLF
ncbi:hypothetical protein Bbelb_178910 [Branchiostoma belcheri]|nr:hypothetical protein Bbelb_178910 [Branchiostoma belcheri]